MSATRAFIYVVKCLKWDKRRDVTFEQTSLHSSFEKWIICELPAQWKICLHFFNSIKGFWFIKFFFGFDEILCPKGQQKFPIQQRWESSCEQFNEFFEILNFGCCKEGKSSTKCVQVSRLILLYLIFEKSSWKNQVRRTGFLVYIELDFYCLCSLQNSVLKLIFAD